MGFSKASAAFAAAAALCVGLGPVQAAELRPAVSMIRVEPTSDGARLVLDASSPLKPNVFFIDGSNPRFVVDLPAVRWPTGRSVGAGPGAGPITGFRYAQRDRAHSRLVLDMRADTRLGEVTRTRHQGGWRFTYVLASKAVSSEEAPFEPVSSIEPLYQAKARASAKVIVIDAGHGGRDSGALSRAGRQEKDIALASALALKAELEARGGYRVVLTRDRDVFIPLTDRVKIAREAKADLFISLHADSNDNHSAKGASVYTLSESGGSRAKALMDNQDWQVDLGDSPRSGRASSILVDLTQRETKNRSAEFADTLTAHLAPVSPLIQNTHRNAGFFVLLAPDVPAVLLELGFMTHADDETRLASPRARAAMMEAVAASIDEHFSPAMERSYAEAGAGGASFTR
jgi:N-acetylmuramoyl-L-alanine amidase